MVRPRGIVRGDKEIIANMRRARMAIGGSALDKDMHAALQPMRDETEQNARQRRQTFRTPKGGHLDEGVVIVRHKSLSALYKEHWISFRKRARKIAHLVEYGTAPHFQPKRNRMHPGARPYPFFRPAFESKKQDVVGSLSNRTWARIRAALLPSARSR